MLKKNDFLIVIPARKGSKRLKNKNKKILGKKPLVNWTIDFAKKINLFQHILMTTDDEQILEISKKKKYFGSMDKASSSF